MNDFNIESRTYYKYTIPSTQIFEKETSSIKPMAISLPRVKFLEADGEYKPAWAVDYIPKEERLQLPPAAPAMKKMTARRMAMRAGEYRVTPFEQLVADLYAQGLTCDEICEKTNRNASAINGAMGRFNNKNLFKKTAA